MTKSFAISFSLAALVAPSLVFPCTCLGPGPSPLTAYKKSSAVFVGTVIASYDSRAGEKTRSTIDPIVYTFDVSQVWKGTIADTLHVVSPRSSPSCGVKFVIGKRYMVYAVTFKGSLRADSCSRTGLFVLMEKDAAELPAPIWTREGE